MPPERVQDKTLDFVRIELPSVPTWVRKPEVLTCSKRTQFGVKLIATICNYRSIDSRNSARLVRSINRLFYLGKPSLRIFETQILLAEETFKLLIQNPETCTQLQYFDITVVVQF